METIIEAQNWLLPFFGIIALAVGAYLALRRAGFFMDEEERKAVFEGEQRVVDAFEKFEQGEQTQKDLDTFEAEISNSHPEELDKRVEERAC